MDLFRKIFYPIESTVYFILLVLAITTVAGSTHYWDATQATTIIIAAATGMVGIWCPPLVEKLFKLKFSHLIDIIIDASKLTTWHKVNQSWQIIIMLYAPNQRSQRAARLPIISAISFSFCHQAINRKLVFDTCLI